jgi:hypothetical protein
MLHNPHVQQVIRTRAGLILVEVLLKIQLDIRIARSRK